MEELFSQDTFTSVSGFLLHYIFETPHIHESYHLHLYISLKILC